MVLITTGFGYGSALGFAFAIIFAVICNLLLKNGILLRMPIAAALLFFFIISIPIFGYLVSDASGESGLAFIATVPFAYFAFMFAGTCAGNYVKNRKINIKKSKNLWKCQRCETVNPIKYTACYKCKYSKDFKYLTLGSRGTG